MIFLRKLFKREKQTATPKDLRQKSMQDREEARAWAERLAETHDWESLAAIFSSTTDLNRQEYARKALREAGAEAVDAIIEQSNKYLGDKLATILIEIRDRRAIQPLLRYFEYAGGTVGMQEKIVKFFAGLGGVEAAQGLVPYLDVNDVNAIAQAELVKVEAAQGLVPYLDGDYGTRMAAAEGLGLLGVPETATALQIAFEKNNWSINRGLEESHTEFARSLISEWTAKRRAAGPNAETMSEQEMLQLLGQYADACITDNQPIIIERPKFYALPPSPQELANIADNRPIIERLRLFVRDIGEELDRRGGIAEMRRVCTQLEVRYQRSVEWAWGGIGEWEA